MKEVRANCMVVDDDEVSRSIITHMVKKHESLNLVFICENAIEAYNTLQQNEGGIDIIFLDVEMPEMSGLELAQNIIHHSLHIILTTSRERYAVEAFEHNIRDYLVKPIKYPRFIKGVEKVLALMKEKQQEQSKKAEEDANNKFLFVRANQKIIKIDPDNIYHIEALSDYIVINLADQKHVVHSTMKGIYKKLEIFKKFIRVHRSYIINLDHIEAVQDTQVIVKGKSIPIGRSYKNDFMERLDIL